LSFLAIDLSLDNFVVIIGNAKEISFSKTIELNHNRNRILFDTLCYLQAKKILNFKKLQTVYSTIGPGNFNGIRMSISTIKAFSLAHNDINIAGVSSLDALSRSTPNLKKNICTAIKSSPGYLYVQWFDKFYRPITKIEVLNIEKKIKLPIYYENFIVVGDGSEILAEKLKYKFVMYKRNLITADGLYGSIKNILKNRTYLKASPLYLKNTNIIKPSLWKTSPVAK
tara:strand:- start:27546 stop:28223 length:678 start_codon:yes stop_codon:yes gene_type:complete